MKPILGIAVLLTWFARCHDVDHHPHEPGQQSDAGVEQEPDGGSDASVESPEDAAVKPEPPPCSGPPGLYLENSCERLAEGVQPYKPLYELWSDGATKERFVSLPAGTQIDVANPDRWAFPVGTRLWKTFSVDGVRIETRVMEKIKPEPGVDSWTFEAYAWAADQLSAIPVSADTGALNALGTEHDIPTQTQCKTCHKLTKAVDSITTDATTGAPVVTKVTVNLDAVNGFEAIQLNHSKPGVTLARLSAQGRFFNSEGGPSVDLAAARLPGDETAQAALGYLHANCGHCHGGSGARQGLDMSAKVGMSLITAPIVMTGMCACLKNWTGRANAAGEAYRLRVVAGHSAISGIVGRMSVRGMGEQMPNVGTEIVDPDGIAAVTKWIDSLDPKACDQQQACVTMQTPPK